MAEELKPPKRERYPLHNWVEQRKKKREREKRNQDGTSTPERKLLKEKRNPGKPPYGQGDQPIWRDLKVTEKSIAAGQRRAKQSESCTDHLYHCPRHHSLRFSGEGWVP